VRTWTPSLKQEQFLALPDSIFEALYGGSVFSGKTELLVILPLARQFHLHPKFKGIILRRTFPELEKEIINRSYDYYGAAGGKYNKQEKRWTFPSGAQMHFGHAEEEQDIRKYDGVEYNYIAFDELTSFSEFQYFYLFTRCRSSSKELPAIIRSSAMPGGIGHAWVRRRFIEPYPEGSVVIQDKVTGIKRFFLRASPTDNKVGLQNDPGYIDRLALLPEAERRAKLGDWFQFKGQVFTDFRIEPLPDEPHNARHVIEPFPIPNYWPKVCMIDWGFTANTVALFAAISPDGRVYIYREYVVKETPISTWATEIGDLLRSDKNVKVVGIDTNAWDERGEEETIAQQFVRFARLQELGITLQKASKARVSGKILIQEYLRFRARKEVEQGYDPTYAEYLLKSQGINAYHDYLSRLKNPEAESNLPKLQIFNTCKELIRVIPLCVYDEKNKEDVAEFEGDDAYDCLRYILKAIVKYQDEAKDEMARLHQDAVIARKFQERQFLSSADAALILSGRKERIRGIPRFHKAMPRVRSLSEIFGVRAPTSR
jgi:hypothetical protein